jgi:hypothetical protein
MSAAYEEIVQGESLMRLAPDARHERICARLHEQVGQCVAQLTSSRLLSPRSVVQMNSGTMLRPDLAIVTAATGKLWLAAEIVNAHDHRVDTVIKKTLYEESNLPRLWMIDPRYDNFEVYHTTEYGLALKRILAGREALTEALLPNLQIIMKDLFAG